MSTKIGIVSEGISDYWALKHIVERYLKEYDVYTIPLQPKITVKGKQDGFGTWQGVFSYISGSDEQKLIVEAIYEGCKFVIIQIDTDVCEQYGIKKTQQTWSFSGNKLKTNSQRVYILILINPSLFTPFVSMNWNAGLFLLFVLRKINVQT